MSSSLRGIIAGTTAKMGTVNYVAKASLTDAYAVAEDRRSAPMEESIAQILSEVLRFFQAMNTTCAQECTNKLG